MCSRNKRCHIDLLCDLVCLLQMWLTAYSKTSGTVWRVLKTFPDSGKVNIFRKQFRCQHKTDVRYRQLGKRETKNTDCRAELDITIRRFDI